MSYVAMFDFVLAVLNVATLGLYALCWTVLGQDPEENAMLLKSGVTNENELAESRNLKTEL